MSPFPMFSPSVRLLLLGLVFHFVYLWSIFDIYFRSPVVHGMTPQRVSNAAHSSLPAPLAPPARRLVLFVADGLRADRLFERWPKLPFEEGGGIVDRAPFLRRVAGTRGSFGVSHTRVPTESRPGHVAMIAGLYEDVSAVTKGWKMNPVEFDSVFNQSRRTWSFGSPDILPMFKHGASEPDKISTEMYDEGDEDFASDDASRLDEWVFERVRKMMVDRASTDSRLRQQLHEDRVVFFLHLLGLDTNGHGHLPDSPEYINNIRLVDRRIEEFTRFFEEYYQHDGRTAYVFSSDHGMADQGSHGDGHPDNTRTPLITWGAGVAGPEKEQVATPTHDLFSESWGLDGVKRKDVRQADIAPLMSALIGLAYPMNNVGRLPVEYLNASAEFKAHNLAVNARQIHEQYAVKRERKRRSEPWFVDYAPLTDERIQKYNSQLEKFLNSGKYSDAMRLANEWMDQCIDGLRYFQTYDWLFLRSLISTGYLGWIVYSMVFLLQTYTRQQVKGFPLNDDAKRGKIYGLAALVYACFVVLFVYKRAPWLYYAYAAFPVYFWAANVCDFHVLTAAFGDVMQRTEWWKQLASTVGFIAALEVLVLSYFYREVLAAWFVVSSVWYWVFAGSEAFYTKQRSTVLAYVVSSLVTAVFLLLPVLLSLNQWVYNAGTVVVLALGAVMQRASGEGQHRQLVTVLLACVAGVGVLVNFTDRCLAAKDGLPLINQYASWALMLGSIAMLGTRQFHSIQHYQHRLLLIYLAFAPLIVLLTISYESLFYASFFATLFTWLEVERVLYAHDVQTEPWEPSTARRSARLQAPNTTSTKHRSLCYRDIRLAIQFLFFINVAFFGTGNMASVSSFQLSSVYRLMTVFSPFAMGGLLVLKILVPFFLLSAVYNVLAHALDLPPFSLFMLSLSMTDVMTLNFFFLVRDDGSWLEIGTSISHFVIACLFEVFSMLLFLISQALVGRIFIPKMMRMKEN